MSALPALLGTKRTWSILSTRPAASSPYAVSIVSWQRREISGLGGMSRLVILVLGLGACDPLQNVRRRHYANKPWASRLRPFFFAIYRIDIGSVPFAEG